MSAGLRADSRIKMLAAELPVPQDLMLLALIADRIEFFRYGFSESASKGKDRPESILEMLLGENKKKTTRGMGFRTAAEFEEALAKIRGE